MQPPAPPSDARTRILDAAEAIVRDRGVAGLTLESAAKQAGISKGGLLYHFASKEILIGSLLARLAAFVEQDFETSVAAQPEGPGQVARAVLNWAFGLTPEAMNARCDRAAAVFLAAFHHDPVLLDPMRAAIAKIRAAVAADGLPAGHGGIILAAGDGLFMARIFGLYTPTPAEMQEMHSALSGLLRPPS